MKKSLILDPGYVSLGRTLWHNLTNEFSGAFSLQRGIYERMTNPATEGDSCSFMYLRQAKISVNKGNQLTIETDDDQMLRGVESVLKTLCYERGCPLVNPK